jgi:hypothetical protein
METTIWENLGIWLLMLGDKRENLGLMSICFGRRWFKIWETYEKTLGYMQFQ